MKYKCERILLNKKRKKERARCLLDIRNNIKRTKGRTGRKWRQCNRMTQAFLCRAAAFPPEFHMTHIGSICVLTAPHCTLCQPCVHRKFSCNVLSKRGKVPCKGITKYQNKRISFLRISGKGEAPLLWPARPE